MLARFDRIAGNRQFYVVFISTGGVDSKPVSQWISAAILVKLDNDCLKRGSVREEKL
jgi:hypothetical protein